SSSDDDPPVLHPVDAAREDEANEMVGVSIGLAQSRLKARATPIEEKSRIMERNGGDLEDHSLFTPELTDEPESLAEEKPPPAPASSSSARSSFTRSILRSGLPLRPRAWSGDSHTSSRGFKKFFPDLGSLAKRSSLALLPTSSSQRRSRSLTWKSASSRLNLDQETVSHPATSPRRSSCSPGAPAAAAAAEEPIGDLPSLEPPAATAPGKYSFSRRPSATPSGSIPPALRRSSSDQSLYLRASSTASSLEHRPQYEHVHSQINSRFKAIKDSLQDSSSRLLSMPTLLHLQDLRGEWGYKQFLMDPTPAPAPPPPPPPPPLSSSSEAFREQSASPFPHAQSPRLNSSTAASTYPLLTEALGEMTGDVVVMGGYRGSILRSAKPPQRQLWVPMKVGLNLRKVDLEVGLTHEDEERMEESIIPSGVLSHIGPVDICRRLLKRLHKCDNAVRGDLRVWNYGYDWRLSPHLLSRRLIRYLEGLPCNAPDVPRNKRGAYVIAHSLGGLITRHAVNQRPDLFAGVLYAGVPQHCVNILGPLRNGDDVLLSSRVLTAQVNFTFRTSFALLPERGHCFIDKRTKAEYLVDFFDPQTWDEYRLSPCISPALPAPTSRGLKDNLPLLGKRFSAVLGSEATTADPAQSPSMPLKPSHLVAPQSAGSSTSPSATSAPPPPSSSSSSCTIPRADALAYLTRTLSEVRRFKDDLVFNPTHQSLNQYPPFAVLYSKALPTVYGARVASRDHIKYTSAYDDLAFAAGDGVCLASAAMLPAGYRIIKDGLVKTERGHVGLMGDLEGVGQCLRALVRGRREGVGV
ncbi:hypothetical protein P175DRAFT_0413615, partial [Aspergillus ochraceoroseus IBT 24754]